MIPRATVDHLAIPSTVVTERPPARDTAAAGPDPGGGRRRGRERFARTESEGQRQMAELAGGDSLEVSPNLWAAIGLVRPRAGAALVGSHAAVIDHLVLSGQSHLEEAYRFGEGVLSPLKLGQSKLGEST